MGGITPRLKTLIIRRKCFKVKVIPNIYCEKKRRIFSKRFSQQKLSQRMGRDGKGW